MVARRNAEETVVRYLGSLLLLLCIPAALRLGWVSFPLSRPLAGICFRLLGHSQPGLGPALTSYGAAAGVIFLIAAVSYWRKALRQLYWAATALLLLVAAAPLQIAFSDPALLKWLADEADWQQRALQFSHHYLPANFGSEAEIWPLLPLDTVPDRLVAGWYFMGIGWYVTLLVAFGIMFAALSGVAARSRARLVATTMALLLLMLGLFVALPQAAQYVLVEAVRAEGRGAVDEARRDYVEVMRLDGWWTLRTDLHERIGVIDASFGRTDTPEYRIYRAELVLDQGRPLEAIAEYEQLATSPELAAFARSRAAGVWTDFGLQLYGTGSFGSAVRAWQKALAHKPSDWLAAFCLTRGYFAVGRNQEAVDLADKFSKTSDPVFLADLTSNVGDARTREGALAAAHVAYRSAYYSDYVYNRRALSSLVGP
jgi:tetratricopeptide (TPR) repeat protein